MKKKLVLVLALLLAQTSFASADLKSGKYLGATEAGEPCRVQIDSKEVSVWYKENGRPWSGMSLLRTNANENLSAGVYTAHGSDDGSRMSLTANVANDGILVSATFRIGFLFGTKVECADLKEQ